MMLALAKFIMARRFNAILVAAFGNFLPLISPGAVGLVVLRKGLVEGALVSIWAVLPLLVMLYSSGMNTAMVWASLFSVVAVFFGASVLAQSQSWALVLKAVVGFSLALGLAMKFMLPGDVESVRTGLIELFAQVQPEANKLNFEPTDLFVAGLLAWVIALTAIASLLLARWWQSLLYNKGGFSIEFHGLRFNRISALVMFVGVTGCYLLGQEYIAWGNLIGLPLLLGGIALVHHAVAFAQIGSFWLVIFYIGLVILLGPLSAVLVGLGFLDSIVDFRSRLAVSQSSGKE